MLRAEEIKQQLIDYADSNGIEKLEFISNKSMKFRLPKISNKENEDLLTFAVINIFNCIWLSIMQIKEWKNDKVINTISIKIKNFLESNEIDFTADKFLQKKKALMSLPKKTDACQKIKVNNPPNQVNDKEKRPLFNNEMVQYPWVIKFSKIKNCFNQQGFEAIMKKIGIGIDIFLENEVLKVKIISIGNKH